MMDSVESNNNDELMDELDRLRHECAAMVTTLKQLEQQELDIQAENRILAREAILSGYDPKVVEPPPPKRRRTAPKKKATTPTQN